MDAAHGPEWSSGLRRADRREMDAWLTFLHDSADLADGVALAAFRQEIAIDTKTDGSFVTDADRTIETSVRTRIADHYPADGVFGEEFGESGAAATRWYLDPIDGTHNFMRGVPLFAFLLAVERDGELQAGIISAPAIGHRWWASRGGGAWARALDGPPRPLHVSNRSRLADAQVLFRGVMDMRGSRVAAGFDALLPEVWRDRGYGDFWGYTLVADGAAEAMMERDLGPWDMAAPWLIVEEAGGRVTDFDGRRSFETGESLASNGLLHGPILERLRAREGEPPMATDERGA